MPGLPARMEAKLERIPFSGCWIWTGAVARNGYGQVRDPQSRRTRLAHRVIYEQVAGGVPAGLDLDHLCRVRCCVNPAHLEPVTRGENTRRGVLPAVLRAKYLAEVTSCARGHEYTPANTYWRPTGGRACKACRTEAGLLSGARRKARRQEAARQAVARGERKAWKKLTDEDVGAIRVLLETSSMTQREIARRFGVSDVTVSAIKTRNYRGN